MNPSSHLIEPLEARIAPATFTVTSLLDDGTDITLRDAVDAANLDVTTADTIVFSPTAGTGTIALVSTIQITGPVTIKGPGIDKVTVSGAGTTRAFRIDDGVAALSPVSISNLGIVGGSGGTNGGAIDCYEPLTLTNVAISGGQVNQLGGGLSVETDGKVTLSGCRIFSNTADYGGGVRIEAGAGITITKTLISGNHAVDYDGGGALLKSIGPAGFINITSSQVVNNDAKLQGGGLHLLVDATRFVTIAKCVIEGNSSQADTGGGVQLAGGRANVSGSFFTGNTADDGGGMYTGLGNSDLVLTKTVFAGNSALGAAPGAGGAIFVGGTAKISGSQFLHNTSAKNGGALAIYGSGSVSGSFFSGNEAVNGGAIDVSSAIDLTLKTNIFLSNRATYGGAINADNGGTVTITGGSFRFNDATSQGGAISVAGMGVNAVSFSVKGALFHQNSSGIFGGAISTVDEASMKISSAQFIENFSLDGGAIAIGGNTGTNDITGSLFRGNAAGGSGGGVFFNTSNALTISSSRFFDNQAAGTGGGAIFTFGVGGETADLKNLTVTGNSAAGAGGGIYNNGAAVTLLGKRPSGNFAPTDPNISPGI